MVVFVVIVVFVCSLNSVCMYMHSVYPYVFVCVLLHFSKMTKEKDGVLESLIEIISDVIMLNAFREAAHKWRRKPSGYCNCLCSFCSSKLFFFFLVNFVSVWCFFAILQTIPDNLKQGRDTVDWGELCVGIILRRNAGKGKEGKKVRVGVILLPVTYCYCKMLVVIVYLLLF